MKEIFNGLQLAFTLGPRAWRGAAYCLLAVTAVIWFGTMISSIVHGNHGMDDFSDPGYAYLGELLANRGFIVASVDPLTFPLADFAATHGDFDPGTIREVRFVFDRSPRGEIYLDEIGFRP